jgi:hypothetical protein
LAEADSEGVAIHERSLSGALMKGVNPASGEFKRAPVGHGQS